MAVRLVMCGRRGRVSRRYSSGSMTTSSTGRSSGMRSDRGLCLRFFRGTATSSTSASPPARWPAPPSGFGSCETSSTPWLMKSPIISHPENSARGTNLGRLQRFQSLERSFPYGVFFQRPRSIEPSNLVSTSFVNDLRMEQGLLNA